MDERLAMLKEVQELEFSAFDLHLFLDTHPQDQAALGDYYTVTNQLALLKRRYEEIYGPLTSSGLTPVQYPWQWLEGPWPWEIEY